MGAKPSTAIAGIDADFSPTCHQLAVSAQPIYSSGALAWNSLRGGDGYAVAAIAFGRIHGGVGSGDQ